MLNLHSLLSGRVNAIRGRVVATSATRKRRSSHPGYRALSAKLAKASQQVRGARHGRKTA
jgi:hypothetical protein